MQRSQDQGRRLLRSGFAWFAAFLALLIGQVTAVAAPEAGEGALRAHAYRMAGDAVRMRVVVEFDREPDMKWFLLRGPHRLIVDLPATTFAFEPDQLDPRGLVAGVRYGNLGTGSSRIILTGKGPFTVENLSLLQNENSPGHRMVIDIVADSEAAFERALADQAATTASTVTTDKSDRVGVRPPVEKPFTIVVDPGHGGIDGGAKSVSGTAEKDLTLSFSRELVERLKSRGNLNVFMTRDDDVFLRLDDRVRIARQHEADLFVSIHADTISLPGIRGATVYTISEKASDEVARAAAERENLSDSVAGIEIAEENQQVADILFDLVRRETHGFSVAFARSLVDELGRAIELINNPQRSAGFRVLRAPDVPSVLVELGYLSNAKDAAQLQDPAWREKAVTSMTAAIEAFAAVRTGAGG
ncbi:N-acetylmuramoyl-L-alanine amidase [Aquibium microcysteis]|uniref:N-acetylmuramoyl-L-alanine amidase n=1 Tax=Aquibium microcysteis TaxID=675281 RepID=UPI00165D1C07|nr:N-acetylmuramoyl-L-alanine amidase [Aquibium microcysteis]